MIVSIDVSRVACFDGARKSRRRKRRSTRQRTRQSGTDTKHLLKCHIAQSRRCWGRGRHLHRLDGSAASRGRIWSRGRAVRIRLLAPDIMMAEVRKWVAEDADISPCQNPSPKCPRESMASAGHPPSTRKAREAGSSLRAAFGIAGLARCIAAPKGRQTETQVGGQWAQLVIVPDCRLCRGVDLRVRLERMRFQSKTVTGQLKLARRRWS